MLLKGAIYDVVYFQQGRLALIYVGRGPLFHGKCNIPFGSFDKNVLCLLHYVRFGLSLFSCFSTKRPAHVVENHSSTCIFHEEPYSKQYYTKPGFSINVFALLGRHKHCRKP